MILTIELDGVKGEVVVDFDDDGEGGLYIEYYAASHAWSEFAEMLAEYMESDVKKAIWEAYDAAVKESKAP